MKIRNHIGIWIVLLVLLAQGSVAQREPATAEVVNDFDACVIALNQAYLSLIKIEREREAMDMTDEQVVQSFGQQQDVLDGVLGEPFSGLANLIIETLPANTERTAALRKLLEARDAVVRAAR